MSHSLDAAVAAGILTDEAAFCGLSEANVRAVAAFNPATPLLVRLRAGRESRIVLSAEEFLSDVKRFASFAADVRDVLAVAK